MFNRLNLLLHYQMDMWCKMLLSPMLIQLVLHGCILGWRGLEQWRDQVLCWIRRKLTWNCDRLEVMLWSWTNCIIMINSHSLCAKITFIVGCCFGGLSFDFIYCNNIQLSQQTNRRYRWSTAMERSPAALIPIHSLAPTISLSTERKSCSHIPAAVEATSTYQIPANTSAATSPIPSALEWGRSPVIQYAQVCQSFFCKLFQSLM